jgi:hypothetical protein
VHVHDVEAAGMKTRAEEITKTMDRSGCTAPASRLLMLVSHPALPRVIDVASLCRAFLDSTD